MATSSEYNCLSSQLKFEVYDVDDYDASDQLDKQEFIGQVECDIQEIVTSPNYSIVKTLMINKRASRRRNCIMHIRGTEFDIGANKTLFKLAA
jgi:hypothetical protein